VDQRRLYTWRGSPLLIVEGVLASHWVVELPDVIGLIQIVILNVFMNAVEKMLVRIPGMI
jgi:hypothetical protein